MKRDMKQYNPQPKTTNIFIGNAPPEYTEDPNQAQRKVPTAFDVRDINQTKTRFKFSAMATPKTDNMTPDPFLDYSSYQVIQPNDSVNLPCKHYKPSITEIKTWMFDGFREWCPFCNQLTNGENIIRSGQKLSGLTRHRMEIAIASPRINQLDFEEDDEGNESDLEMDVFKEKDAKSNPALLKNTGGPIPGQQLFDTRTGQQNRPQYQNQSLYKGSYFLDEINITYMNYKHSQSSVEQQNDARFITTSSAKSCSKEYV